jgi:hypothetical protein
MKWLFLMCASGLALAQKLEVSAKKGASDDRATIVISIVLPEKSDVVGVQWETTFAEPGMTIDNRGPEASEGAKAAAKSLTCANKMVKNLQTYTCILIGGQRGIEAGPIALFNCRISPKAPSGSIRVRLSHVEAVTRDFRKLPLPDAESTRSVKQ